jgi:hypothetical protein
MAFYQVVAVKPDTCYPAILRANVVSGPYSQSVSNLKDYSLSQASYLTIVPQQTSVGADSGSVTYINIYTNLTDWNATIDKTWATLVKDTSKNNITVIVKENPSMAIRMAIVTVTATGITPLTVLVIQDGASGIQRITTNQKIKIYPNPSTGIINVDYFQPYQAATTIEVYDMMGKLIMKTVKENQAAGEYKTEIDLSGNAKGIYFVKVLIGSETYYGKVVIE